MIKNTDQLSTIIQSILDVWSGKPWHGRSVHSLLARVTSYNSQIRRIALHMIAWQQFVLSKIKGSPLKIRLNSADDWPIDDDRPWSAIINQMESNIQEITQVISKHDDNWLQQKVPGESYNYAFLLQGLSHHDIYHIGQIVLLEKMYTKSQTPNIDSLSNTTSN